MAFGEEFGALPASEESIERDEVGRKGVLQPRNEQGKGGEVREVDVRA